MVPPEPPGPTPIPVEGDVQIFADPECTRYADGTQVTAYARINSGAPFDWSNNDLEFLTPSPEYPDDPYQINWYVDWQSSYNRHTPFEVGEVVQLTAPEGYTLDAPEVIYYKP